MKEEHLRSIMQNYPITGDLTEAIPYGSGHINDTYRLTYQEDGRERRYIL